MIVGIRSRRIDGGHGFERPFVVRTSADQVHDDAESDHHPTSQRERPAGADEIEAHAQPPISTVAAVPTTFLLTSFYWDNFIAFGMGPARMALQRFGIPDIRIQYDSDIAFLEQFAR